MTMIKGYNGVGAVLRIIAACIIAELGGGVFASGQTIVGTNATIIDDGASAIDTNTTIVVHTDANATVASNITQDLLHFDNFVEIEELPNLQGIAGVLIQVSCPQSTGINLRCLCPAGIRWTIEPTPNEDDPVTLSMQPANILLASVETEKKTLDLADTYSTLVFTYTAKALTSPLPPLTGVRIQVPARQLKYVGVAEGNRLQIRKGILSLERIIVTDRAGLFANITTSETSPVLDLSLDRRSVANISLVEPLDNISLPPKEDHVDSEMDSTIAATPTEVPAANETDSTITEPPNEDTVSNETDITIGTPPNEDTMSNETDITIAAPPNEDLVSNETDIMQNEVSFANETDSTSDTNATTVTTITNITTIVVVNNSPIIGNMNLRAGNDATGGVPIDEPGAEMAENIRPGPVKLDVKDSSRLYLKGTVHSGEIESRSTVSIQGNILSLSVTGGAAVVVNPFPTKVVQGNPCDNVEIARFAGTCNVDDTFTMTPRKRAVLFNNTAVKCGGSSEPVEDEEKTHSSTAYSVFGSNSLAALLALATAMPVLLAW